MGAFPELSTPRLKLRRWRPGDREPFAALNADPQVMEHFPRPLTREESDSLLEGIKSGFERDGFGLWAVEVSETGELAGFTGLATPSFSAHFTPAGDRLRRHVLYRVSAPRA